LQAFGFEQVNNLISDIFDAKETVSADITGYILEKSGGNPFFAINLIRELAENSVLYWGGTSLEIDWDKTPQIPVSSAIVDMILRRTENLPPEQVELLGKAAAIGREFEIALLLKLSDLEEENIVATVDELIALHLLEQSRERGRFLFAHERIRQVFYDKLNESQRRKIHREIAGALEVLSGSNPNENIFELAYHYIEGEDKQKALEYVWLAANKAKTSFANEVAVKYYLKAIELLEHQGEKGGSQWIAAYQDLTEIYVRIGRDDEAITLSQALLSLVHEPLSRAVVYKKIAIAYFNQGDWAESEENFKKGLALLRQKIPTRRMEVIFSLVHGLLKHMVHDLFPVFFHHRDGRPVREVDREIVSSCLRLAWLYCLSDITKYINLTLQMLNLSETRIGKSRELGIFLCSYALMFANISLFNKSIKLQKKALKILEELGDEWAFAVDLETLGYTYCWKGDYSNGIPCLESAYEKHQRIGDLWESGAVVVNLGVGTYFQRISDYQKAITYIETINANYQQEKNTFGYIFTLTNLALIQIETGDYDKAEELLVKGVNLNRCTEKFFEFLRCYIFYGYGFLELERGNYHQAINYLEQAKKIFLENTLLKDYVLSIFPLLADAYLEKNGQRQVNLNQPFIDFPKARTLCNDALKQTRAWPNHYGITLRVAAKFYQRLGKIRRAERYYLKSIKHHETIHLPYETAKTYWDYGAFLNSQNRKHEAKRSWRQAYEIFKAIGANAYLKQLEELGIDATMADRETTRERLTSERRKNTIIATARSISSILNIDVLLEKVMDSAMELVGAERGVLLLYPENARASARGARKLEPKVIRNITPGEVAQTGFNMSHGIISQVEKAQKSLIIGNALADDALKNRFSVALTGLKSAICTPIMLKGEILGVIYLDNRLITGLFGEEELEIIELIANQAGVSIENARLCRSLEQRVAERTGQLEMANQELNMKNAELSTANEQLKEHAAMVAELATIKERNRVAMDVHDTIGHTLTLLLRLLEVSKSKFRKEPAKSEAELANAIQVTRNGLQEIQSSISGLMPERLATHNLAAILEQLRGEFQSSGVTVDVTMDGSGNLPNEFYVDVIYRTCQEALTNALRHGKAKNVAIFLKFGQEQVKLFIVDDGCGCKQLKQGLGLSGMTQRISSLQGRCRFFSDGENGFNIQAEIPLR
jgi:signal transduction histidine kinase/Tfp pilus assembly protein PilF